MPHQQQNVRSTVEGDATKIDLWTSTDMSRFDQDVHVIPIDSVMRRFRSNRQTGLSSAFVSEAQTCYGSNQITPAPSPNYFRLLFKQLFMGFNSILLVGGILAIIAYQPLGGSESSITNLSLGIVLLSVTIFNAFLNVYQKLKSIKIIAAFAKLLPKSVSTRRDGVEQHVPIIELVPGDIILIKMGDVVPADCRFLTCEGLKLNSAELTGETKPVSITVECTSENLMETTNLGFYSSLVEEGMGEAVVVATGNSTILGKMSRTTQEGSNERTTNLHREVNRFVLFVLVADVMSIIIVWITWGGWLNKSHPTFITRTGNILNSIGMIVSFLPIGLPSAITLALAIVAKRMSQQRILGKSLQIIESFNSVSIIATDKTGTLTKNKMVVSEIFWDTDNGCKVFDDGDEESPTRTSMSDKSRQVSFGLRDSSQRTAKVSPAIERPSINGNHQDEYSGNRQSRFCVEVFDDLLLGAALCNNAKVQLVRNQSKDRDMMKANSELHVTGDPVDVALYNLCVYQCYMYIDEIRCVNPRLKTLPFNSVNKFMITANRMESHNLSSTDPRNTVLITMKGAPEIVIQRCSTYKTNGGQILPLTTEIKEKILNQQEILSRGGYRIIAMCQQKLTQMRYDQLMQQHDERRQSRVVEVHNLNGFPQEKYCFLGLFSLFDSLRFDAPDSILRIRDARIRVAMITGDHPATARAIGEQVNIFSANIAKRNGIDSFQMLENETKQLVFRLYRNETLFQEHIAGTITALRSSSTTIQKHIKLEKQVWYRRWYASLKNQLTEAEPIFYKEKEKERIPYAIVIAGNQVDYLDDFMWNWVLSHEELIFARTSPEQKLRIIMEFQRRGEIVAAIGDGTNDAPSLKYADLGIAMQTGTSVSKEAADLILLDNRFSSIVSSIETGRLLADNLKKVVMFLLPAGSWSELWPIMFNMWLGVPISLSTFLATILCVLNGKNWLECLQTKV
ncbi:unnamed protein product [Adineta ricciae]|uniref:Cation-transporting P-type ATPase N-terminal domain-containing protein n=1 Tax=Adineta ricciae TaxID=249248 RepID=A0A816E6F7_ADIRI|nr:unnamed protein product [Adineta ricciae]